MYIGIVGLGVRGTYLMKELHKSCADANIEITAVCDTWRPQRERAAALVKDWYGKKCRQFTRYEDLLALPDIDGVIIATPDFSHCSILVDALNAGKDAYVEKPMAIGLNEAKLALETARKTKRIVQVGTQWRSSGAWKAAAKTVKSGVLGDISRVEIAWNDSKPRWKRGLDMLDVREEDIDWLRFLMNRPYRPFDAHQYREWQLYRDFTNGLFGLLGSHLMDAVSFVMDESYPKSVVAHGGHYAWKDEREHEDTVYALYDYDRGGFMCELTIGLGNSAESGLRIYGTNGMLTEKDWKICGEGGNGPYCIKEESKIEPEPDEDHIRNWIDCMRSRKAPNAPIEAGYQHSVATIMACEALRTSRRMGYDSAKRTISGS